MLRGPVVRKWVLLAAVAAVGAAHGQNGPGPGREMNRYTNKSWRWSISYPAGWTMDGKDPDLVRVRSASEHALCSIFSGPMDRFNSVDELTDFMLAQDARFFRDKGQKFTVLSRKRMALPNRIVGNDVLVEIGPGGRSRRLHALVDGRGFAIDCEAYTKNWSKLEASYQWIIGSFTVGR